METPPRAWGRPERLAQIIRLERNTPTGVGKTGAGFSLAYLSWKHPHGRGEDD